jgi:urease accessory protein
MTGHSALLAALQHGDSFFPSGGVAFSWGLETLLNDGLVGDPAQVHGFVSDQLRHRWATLDRPALAASHRCAGDLDGVVPVDELLEVMSLAREFREGSRRAGAALLGVHEKLGTDTAAAYRRLVRDGCAPGHLAVVQGVLWRGAGLDENDAAAVSAYTLCVGFLGAALRLGRIGHVESQRSLSVLREDIADILMSPAPALEDMTAYAPEADIAAMRHETAEVRLFVT